MIFILLAALVSLQTHSFAGSAHDPLPTVSQVDLGRYMGVWHQIANIPIRFQKNCNTDVTATYTLREDGKVTVENECTNQKGTRKYIKGVATVKNTQTNAQLDVRFFWFSPKSKEGNYYIIDLDKNYEHVMVGEPRRKFLWILARQPSLSKATYDRLLSKAQSLGYDTSRLALSAELRDTQGL